MWRQKAPKWNDLSIIYQRKQLDNFTSTVEKEVELEDSGEKKKLIGSFVILRVLQKSSHHPKIKADRSASFFYCSKEGRHT